MPTALVVDDDREFRRVLRKLLERCGLTVLEAQDGLEAWLVLVSEAGAVDLMLTDLSMPRMDGLELAFLVRQHYPATAVSITSGYPLQCKFPVLSKPFKPGQIRAFVEQFACVMAGERTADA